MRAFITGGAGFIGSHLAEALLASGNEVSILDDLSTGAIQNIEHLKGRPGFRYTIDSVTNEPLLAELIDDCDVVFHLAAAVGVKLIVEAPVHTIETNVHGTEVVLRHANKKKKLVVIASTSEVYGKSTAVPFNEDDDLVMGPTPKHRWAYACSKAIDEFLALAYWKEKKLPVIIARFFNTVGPRQTGRYGMVIPNFVRQGLSGQTITVYGDGTQTRSFCHVADVVEGLLRLVQEPKADWRSVQHRQRSGSHDHGPRRESPRAHRQSVVDRHGPVRTGLRGRLRGHAAAGPRPAQDPGAGGLCAEIRSRRDPHRRDRSPARSMSVLATLRRKARSGAEAALRSNARTVRRLLLATGRDEAPLPEIVQIESTNICNAKCVFCPRDDMERRQGIMDMALFRKIVDECVELGIEHVRMHNYGEPFVDRALVEKVRYAKQKGVPQVGMISNGSLLNETAARGMIDAGLDAINISVDASGKETFEKTRLGLKYDKVIANVERLLALREAAGTTRPKLILSFVRQNNSEDERAFIEHWRKRADKIHITDLHNWAGTLNQRSDVNYPCYRPWLTFTALWDGRVSLCCADFDGRTILGDLRTSTIQEIWNSEAYRAVRRQHLESGGPDICRSCDLPKKDSPLWVTKLF